MTGDFSVHGCAIGEIAWPNLRVLLQYISRDKASVYNGYAVVTTLHMLQSFLPRPSETCRVQISIGIL